VLTTAAAPDDATSAWLAAGAKVLTLPQSANGIGVDLVETLDTLAGLGVLQAMFEGGARVAGALVKAGLVDRLLMYVAPLVLGTDALPAFALGGPGTMTGAQRWQLVDVTRLGADVRLTYEPGRQAGSVPERGAD
jgi:diaminohydroxyphosphoribosylaminopyrimidine deaminase/5-amino-6-(5-phosphoribosylamino)uracil reductase